MSSSIKLSYHEHIIGKPELRRTDEHTELVCNGRKVNLGYGWSNIELDWDEVFVLVTEGGYATAPYLSSDNRRASTFVQSSLAFVDIDSGMSIEQLLKHPFYLEYGAGFYTTPSHTMEKHRFRVMHRLETPITSVERMRNLYRGLMTVYGEADVACKDGCRVFYGTVNATFREMTNLVLPDTAVDVLVSEIEKQDAEAFTACEQKKHTPLTDSGKQQVLNLLHQTYVGEYPIWRNIGWGLKSGGFTLADFQYVTCGMMRQKTAADAKAVWDAGKPDGEVTMGTVIHFLKQRHGADCIKPTPKWKQERQRVLDKYRKA